MKTLLTWSFFGVVLSISLIGCGGSGEMPLTVDKAYCPATVASLASPPDALKIESYHVVVTGAFGQKEFTFEGNLAQAKVDGIPPGDNLTLLVEAVNNRSQVICRRQLAGISIKKGKTNPIAISLLAVPFVANLSNGNVVTATALVFKGYGEPAGTVEIVDQYEGNEVVLFDLSTNLDVVSPANADASFQFKPAVLPLGPHTFVVRDADTGETSTLDLLLVGAGRIPGTGILSAGFRDQRAEVAIGRADLFAETLEQSVSF
jgi:hypothetical protein